MPCSKEIRLLEFFVAPLKYCIRHAGANNRKEEENKGSKNYFFGRYKYYIAKSK